jgi:hypothetical protein
MRAKTVNENIEFERGRDPKESMGIGEEEIRLVNKLDRLARKYGFEKSPVTKEDLEEGIRIVQKWLNPEDETQIILYIDEEWTDGGYMINYEDLNGSGNDSADQWLDQEEWEYHYGEDAEMY